MTPTVGEDFIQWRPPSGDQTTWATSTSRSARTGCRRQAGQLDGRGRAVGGRDHRPAYAMDDQTAIRVVDGEVDFVSKGAGSSSGH